MENLLKELEEVLNWKERVCILFFSNTCIKIYKKGIEKGVNAVL